MLKYITKAIKEGKLDQYQDIMTTYEVTEANMASYSFSYSNLF